MTRYELLDRIGVGGMAEIFRGKAVAAGGFEKPVAIKRILPHLSQDPRFVELLIAEAKVLSLLKHRNIVQIFDVGLGDDKQNFLVMEFVDGKDIGAVQRTLEIQKRRVPFDLVLHIGAEICEALEHAHTARAPDGKSMSLVHRDVSPSNVLLSRAGEVKLTDFGIAKRAEQDPTQAGAVRGKFAYISPEQAKNEHLDPRSDVFSVGILLWELVCNRRLFSQLDDLAALRAVREGSIPRPSEIDPRLPVDIDAILMTALSRDKARRYPSAGQLGHKLRALRYTLDVTVGDPGTELAKLIESTEENERLSRPMIAAKSPLPFDSEATVIRIHTADAFSARDNDASIVAARAVIDRFEEEEETRLAQFSGEQMAVLRGAPTREGHRGQLSPSGRSRRDSEEATRMRVPLDLDAVSVTPTNTPMPHTPIGADEQTKIVAPRDRRTPEAQRAARPASESGGVRGKGGTVPPQIPQRGMATPQPGAGQMSPMPQPPGMSTHGGGAPYQGPPPMPVPQSGSSTLPFSPAPPPTPYPGWGPPQMPMHMQQIAPQLPGRDATPTTQDPYDRPMFAEQPRPSMPQVAGWQKPKKVVLQPWMLVVGAIVMATLAFVITRAFIR